MFYRFARRMSGFFSVVGCLLLITALSARAEEAKIEILWLGAFLAMWHGKCLFLYWLMPLPVAVELAQINRFIKR